MDSESCTHTRAEVLVLNRSVQRLHHRRYYYCCLSAGVGERARRRAAMRLWELVWSPLQRHLRHGKGRLSPAWQTLQELSVGRRLQAAYGRRAPPPPHHQAIDSHIALTHIKHHLTNTMLMRKLHATIRTSKYQCHQVIGLSMRSASAPRARHACAHPPSDVRASALSVTVGFAPLICISTQRPDRRRTSAIAIMADLAVQV